MSRKFILLLDGSAAAIYKLTKLVAGVSDAEMLVAHSTDSAKHQIKRFLPVAVVVSSAAFAELGEPFLAEVQRLSPHTSVLIATPRAADNGEVVEELIPARTQPSAGPLR